MNQDNGKDKKPEPPKRPEPKVVTIKKERNPSETRETKIEKKKKG